MGYIPENQRGKTKTCKCYILDDDKLMCYAKGIIGTLSQQQIGDLCRKDKDDLRGVAKEPTDEMKDTWRRFNDALERANDEYDEWLENNTSSIEKYMELLKEHIGE